MKSEIQETIIKIVFGGVFAVVVVIVFVVVVNVPWELLHCECGKKRKHAGN